MSRARARTALAPAPDSIALTTDSGARSGGPDAARRERGAA